MDNDVEEINLTHETVLEALGSKLGSDKFELVKYKLEQLPERIGLLGDHAILFTSIINKETNLKEILSFFVKFFPQMKAPAEFAAGIGAFEKEIFVYDLFTKFKENNINIIKSCIPMCYWKEDRKYLVLDNLIDQDFQQLDKHQLLDKSTVLIVLQALAKLHAASLIYEEKRSKELEKSYRLNYEYKENFAESFYNDKEGFANEQGIKASIKCVVKEIDIFNFPNKLLSGKNFSEVAESMCFKIYELVKPSTKFRNVLCHGDLWATNFLLKFDDGGQPKECKFVDFQCGRYVPPAQDVLSMIYLTTSREFRGQLMYQVIGMYYSYLEKYLKINGCDATSIIPFNEFMESCEEQKLFAIVQTALYFPLILISNDLVEEYFSDEELNRKALFEDRSYLVLKHMEKDESYTSRLKESVQDLKDYCEYK